MSLFLFVFVNAFFVIGSSASNPLSGTKYLVYQNPFHLYVKFIDLAGKCGAAQECLCYYGYELPTDKLMAEQLLPMQKMDFLHKRLSKDNAEPIVVNCLNAKGFHTYKDYAAAQVGSTAKERRKWGYLHGGLGYGGGEMKLMKICVSSIPKITFGVTYYEVTVRVQTDATVRTDVYKSNVSRMPDENDLRIQFNTRMPVMQPFGEVGNDQVKHYFAVPQIATFKGFDNVEKEEISKFRVEDTFVEFDYSECNNAAAVDRGKKMIYYSPSELKGVDEILEHPPGLPENYVGSLLTYSNGTWTKRDQTEAWDILFDFMESYNTKNAVRRP